jgi:hypothetical protein
MLGSVIRFGEPGLLTNRLARTLAPPKVESVPPLMLATNGVSHLQSWRARMNTAFMKILSRCTTCLFIWLQCANILGQSQLPVTRPQEAISSLRIVATNQDQLFGTVASWQIFPPKGATNCTILAWAENVSNPAHPRRLPIDLERKLENSGTLYFGFVNEESGELRVAISLAGFGKSCLEVLPVNPGVVQRQRLSYDTSLDVTVPMNKVIKLCTIEIPTQEKTLKYVFSLQYKSNP